MASWLYNGRIFDEELLDNQIGFVYIITNLKTDRQYVGKKLFKFSRTKKPLKGKIRKRRSKIDSNWRTYYGSNKELIEDVKKYGEENFRREILHLCRSKGSCNYYEVKEQIERGVLESANFYNDWIIVKVHRSHIKK